MRGDLDRRRQHAEDFGATGRTVTRSERTRGGDPARSVGARPDADDPLRRACADSPPATSGDPKDPGIRVESGVACGSGSTSPSRSSRRRPGASAARVDPAPLEFAVGLNGATVTGRVFRYVTWRNENCPVALCEGNENTKRLTVAAVLDAPPSGDRRMPIWLSTVIADPDTAPPGTQAPPGGGPGSGDPVTAQSFFLYDTPCGQSSRQQPAAAHATHDTASSGATAVESSTCENPNSGRQPDLMGGAAPSGDRNTPLFQYSSDLSGGYEGGFTMIHRGATCAASYAQSAASTLRASANGRSMRGLRPLSHRRSRCAGS